MTSFRAIFYDAGRTLLRPKPNEREIWDFLGRQLGTALDVERKMPDVGHFFYARLGEDGLGAYDSDERARSFWGSYYVQAMRDAGVDLPQEQLVSAATALSDWYTEPETWELYPDVIETLDGVRARGLLQGIVSDWGSDLISLLHAHELTDHLDFVVASANVRSAKPHPDIFRYALARAQLEAHDVLYVGDSYLSDVLGARTVGITPVLIDREGKAPEVDCFVVRALTGVLDLIDR
jgi:REG-2-like HAD superfamily hydrolase